MTEDYTNSLLSAVLKAVPEALKGQQMIARHQMAQGNELAIIKEKTSSIDISDQLQSIKTEISTDHNDNLTQVIRNLIEGVEVMQENMNAFTTALNKQAEFLTDLQLTINDMAEQQQTTSARLKGVELRMSTQSIEEEADAALDALNKTLEELQDLDT